MKENDSGTISLETVVLAYELGVRRKNVELWIDNVMDFQPENPGTISRLEAHSDKYYRMILRVGAKLPEDQRDIFFLMAGEASLISNEANILRNKFQDMSIEELDDLTQ